MSRMNRRRFLQTTTASAAAAGFWLTGGITESRAKDPSSPMRRLNIAFIGVGGKGESSITPIAGMGENIVAFCDADDNRARNMYNRFPNVPKFKDYRQMLERQRDIEAVLISTPDHH